jgi:hypothetical protein
MPEHADNEPIQLSGDYLVEFHDVAINLTGIPDDQFCLADEDGNPVVETESMDHPLLEFHDVAINLTGIPDDEFAEINGVSEADFDEPSVRGTAHPPVPPTVPPKSV